MKTPMQSEFNPVRRKFISVFAVFMISGFPAFQLEPAHALTTSEAEALIETVAREIRKAINESESESEMFKRFGSVLESYADLPIIARSALGVEWRRATAKQRREFTAAFSRYLALKYGKHFRSFQQAQVRIRRSRLVKSGVLVETVVSRSGSPPSTIDWQVSDKSGETRIFNLYIEGVSLLSIERQEIGLLLDRVGGDIDVLVAELKSHG